MKKSMIKSGLVWSAIFVLGLNCAYAQTTQLIVATYNIDAKVMGDHQGQRNLMQSANVDIFGLQEINYKNERFANNNIHSYNPLPAFVEKDYAYSYYGNAVNFAEGGYGIATISKYKFDDESTTRLILSDISYQHLDEFEATYAIYNPTKPDTVTALDGMWGPDGIATQGVMEPRIYTRVVISKDNQKIAFYNTHLSFESIAIRQQQMQQLLTVMQKDPIKYQVLVGDFNTDQSTKEWDMWRNDFNLANGMNYIWYDTFTGQDDDMNVNSIDNIIVSKNITIKDVQRVDSDLSDHVPLIAVLELN